MAMEQRAGSMQNELLGKTLVTLGLTALLADLSFLTQPLGLLVGRLQDGLMGILPTLGGAILDATQAIAFHQVNYASLVGRILVLFIGLAAVVIGLARLYERRSRMAPHESEGLVDSMRRDW